MERLRDPEKGQFADESLNIIPKWKPVEPHLKDMLLRDSQN